MDGRFVNRPYGGGKKEFATGYLLVACGDGYGRFVNRPYGGEKELANRVSLSCLW